MYRHLSVLFVLLWFQGLAQSEHLSEVSLKHSIEGKFQFSYESQTRQVEISSSQSKFIEFNELGEVLGEGEVLTQKDSFVIRPTQVSTYSVLNGNLTFQVVSNQVDKIIVNVFLDDDTQALIELIKI